MFGFSDDTCLSDVIGAAPILDEEGTNDKLQVVEHFGNYRSFAFQHFEFRKKTNLGFRVATVPNNKYVATRYAKNPESDDVKEYINKQNVFDITDSSYDDKVGVY